MVRVFFPSRKLKKSKAAAVPDEKQTTTAPVAVVPEEVVPNLVSGGGDGGKACGTSADNANNYQQQCKASTKIVIRLLGRNTNSSRAVVISSGGRSGGNDQHRETQLSAYTSAVDVTSGKSGAKQQQATSPVTPECKAQSRLFGMALLGVGVKKGGDDNNNNSSINNQTQQRQQQQKSISTAADEAPPPAQQKVTKTTSTPSAAAAEPPPKQKRAKRPAIKWDRTKEEEEKEKPIVEGRRPLPVDSADELPNVALMPKGEAATAKLPNVAVTKRGKTESILAESSAFGKQPTPSAAAAEPPPKQKRAKRPAIKWDRTKEEEEKEKPSVEGRAVPVDSADDLPNVVPMPKGEAATAKLPNVAVTERRDKTEPILAKSLNDQSPDKALVQQKPTTPSAAEPKPHRQQKKAKRWDRTAREEKKKEEEKKKMTPMMNISTVSLGGAGLSHAMPRRRPRILPTLDGRRTIAPFFTNAFAFSNHFKCRFTVDGLEFCCTEQFYMYYKARVFGDDGSANAILRSEDPKLIKRLGSQIRLFDTAKWRQVSILVMLIGNWKKYEQNPVLRHMLFETGDALLVEASPDDVYWGIGVHVDNTDKVRDMDRWCVHGKNVLGRLLTRVRDTFKEREQYKHEWEEVRARLPELYNTNNSDGGGMARRTI